jgi:phosphopantothenoylcysteine decarboxylase/phosphopantothenate--cysteine ligase
MSSHKFENRFEINLKIGDSMLKGKKILLGVTGGIAAYKAVDLASKLTAQGAIVKTILTKNACEIVSPLTFKSITHQRAITKMFDPEADIEHISLADWADLLVIAPATANIIGKIAAGIADDLLSTVVMATTAPVLIVPAMNIHMYENPLVQANIEKLSKLDYYFMEPEYGQLACGYKGKGRFPKTLEILFYIKTHLSYSRDLVGEKILITAGANQEPIDPMRYITNRSSGKMGLALARAAAIRGAEVLLIQAAVQEKVPDYLQSLEAISAADMLKAVEANYQNYSTIIMSAAVADFTSPESAKQKLKKSDGLHLDLVRTTDILKFLGQQRNQHQLLVGFAAETENIVENARTKLNQKQVDMIVANNLRFAGQANNEITIVEAEAETKLAGDKFELSHKILDAIKIMRRAGNE